MSEGLIPSQPTGPVSVGNIVSTAFVLYRSHLKLYLGLALKAVLWGFVPIYGWAKASMINAQISRLGFNELRNQPENSRSAYNQLQPKMWYFLVTAILVIILLFAINIGIFIASSIVAAIPILIIGAISPDSAVGSLLIALIQLVINLLAFAIQLWFQARFFMPELPLAVEANVDAVQTISRSWELTKGFGFRIQLILLIAYLITIPLWTIVFIPAILIISFFIAASTAALPTTPVGSTFGIWLLFMIFLVILLTMFAAIFITPFWQSLKAVIYYDLRSRKEGLGLQLRDSEDYF